MGLENITSVPVCFLSLHLSLSQCSVAFLKGSKDGRFETVIEAFTAITMNHNETC